MQLFSLTPGQWLFLGSSAVCFALGLAFLAADTSSGQPVLALVFLLLGFGICTLLIGRIVLAPGLNLLITCVHAIKCIVVTGVHAINCIVAACVRLMAASARKSTKLIAFAALAAVSAATLTAVGSYAAHRSKVAQHRSDAVRYEKEYNDAVTKAEAALAHVEVRHDKVIDLSTEASLVDNACRYFQTYMSNKQQGDLPTRFWVTAVPDSLISKDQRSADAADLREVSNELLQRKAPDLSKLAKAYVRQLVRCRVPPQKPYSSDTVLEGFGILCGNGRPKQWNRDTIEADFKKRHIPMLENSFQKARHSRRPWNVWEAYDSPLPPVCLVISDALTSEINGVGGNDDIRDGEKAGRIVQYVLLNLYEFVRKEAEEVRPH